MHAINDPQLSWNTRRLRRQRRGRSGAGTWYRRLLRRRSQRPVRPSTRPTPPVAFTIRPSSQPRMYKLVDIHHMKVNDPPNSPSPPNVRQGQSNGGSDDHGRDVK
jgi:hypothetical protein